MSGRHRNDNFCVLRAKRDRRGSIYAVTLIIATIVTMTGLASIQVGRIRARGSQQLSARRDAAALAASAAELALLAMQDPNWRSNHAHDEETASRALGPGTISYKFVDLVDTNLANDPGHSVLIVGIGRIGTTTFLQSVQGNVTVAASPMAVLGTAAHTQNQMIITSSTSLTVDDAPLSTNNSFINHGILYGDVEAISQGGSGAVTGTTTIPASVKPMPAASVFDTYVALATSLNHTGDIDKVVLAPGINQYGGGLNTDGCYYIHTGGSDLTIKLSRIHGTLIVDTAGGRVYLDTNLLMQNARADYPVLLVRGGDVYFQYFSRDSDPSKSALRESDIGHNFNPSGAEYEGDFDSDTNDAYPSEIHGLVYVEGNVKSVLSSIVRGCIVATGDISIDAITDFEPQFIHDSDLLSVPPQGFGSADGSPVMTIDTTSWRREVLP